MYLSKFLYSGIFYLFCMCKGFGNHQQRAYLPPGAHRLVNSSMRTPRNDNAQGYQGYQNNQRNNVNYNYPQSQGK